MKEKMILTLKILILIVVALVVAFCSTLCVWTFAKKDIESLQSGTYISSDSNTFVRFADERIEILQDNAISYYKVTSSDSNALELEQKDNSDNKQVLVFVNDKTIYLQSAKRYLYKIDGDSK